MSSLSSQSRVLDSKNYKYILSKDEQNKSLNSGKNELNDEVLSESKRFSQRYISSFTGRYTEGINEYKKPLYIKKFNKYHTLKEKH